MKIFSESSSVDVWGPTAGVKVTINALSGIVGNSWVLEGVSTGASEIVDVRQCFNDESFIYALGNDQGKCYLVLAFVVFLGRKNCNEGEPVKAIEDGMKAYSSSRISEKPAPQTFTIGGFTANGWITGIDIGSVEADKGIGHGRLSCIIQLPW